VAWSAWQGKPCRQPIEDAVIVHCPLALQDRGRFLADRTIGRDYATVLRLSVAVVSL